MLEGTSKLTYGDEAILRKGDCIYFNASVLI